MDVGTVVLKVSFFLVFLVYIYDLFYRDIYLKETKEFFIPGKGYGAGKIENDFIRRLLKFIMMLICLWIVIDTP